MAVCYRHPNQETGVSCSNCGRPICTDCMTTTSVGMRCPECAREKTQVKTIGSLVTEPTATYVLIALNVLVYFGSTAAGGGLLQRGGGDVISRGLLNGDLVAGGDYWRLVTSGFLHSGFVHLLMNMVFLYFLGRMVEPALGRARYLVVYGVSLLGGSLGALLLSPEAFTVGASGAIWGILGAAIAVARDRGISVMDSGLGGLLVFNLAFTFLIPGISIGGHLGGFAAGLLAGLALTEGQKHRREVLAYAACGLLAVVVVGGALLAAGRDTL